MNKIIIVTLLMLSAASGQAQDSKYHKIEIQTSAICEMCQYAIEKEMALEKGVKSATLNLENKILTVTYLSKKTDADEIRKRVALTGYHADSIERDSLAYKKLPFCCKDGAHGSEKKQQPKQ